MANKKPFVVRVPDPDGEVQRKLFELVKLGRRTIGNEVAAMIERTYEERVPVKQPQQVKTIQS